MNKTVRISMTTLVVAMVAAGCSSSVDGGVGEEAQTRTVTHDYGITEVPTDAQRIVATDETAAMALLAVGVVPDVVFTGFGSPIGDALLAEAGSKVIDVPPVGAPPTEDVLSVSPDLVVGSNYGDDTLYRAISDTVATVPMPYLAPWQQSLAFVAEMFDRHDEAIRLESVLNAQIDSLRAKVEDRPMSLSVLMYASDILAIATASAPSSVLAESVGLDAPEMQKADPTESTIGPWTALSPEHLASQDADVIAVLDEGVYSADTVRSTGGFGEVLGARALDVNGDMWTAEHPFATYWLLEDLDAIVAGRLGDIGSEATAQTRYANFTSEIA
ncbi:ABC transporter substrate-binding protein [Rhodococcus sovatensis]|uniref:ABC transporter substrate-binding protein n=1 Tax=Rhodococcus sovatensis TaxID=1805840 RepID=A0ABZ2PN81_9NOCA